MQSDLEQTDVLIIGAGIAGASAAYFLASHKRVILLEREDAPGRHSTGRSAAVYVPAYGPPAIRALTTTSRSFFDNPPQGFCDHPLLSPRGMITVAPREGAEALRKQTAQDAAQLPAIQPLEPAEAVRRVPVLRRDAVAAAALDPDAEDIDVDALHQGFLRGARARGARLVCDADPLDLKRGEAGWIADSPAGTFTAPVVINAAGAWADEVAGMADIAPAGLVPKRRTALTFAPPAEVDPASWPVVLCWDPAFYFKPEAGLILVSPAVATPLPPCDVQPEEIDLAIAIDRLQRFADLPVERIAHKWAGLRSFVSDGVPVIAFEPSADGFFWLAGQGGYGIQTSPAAGRLVATQVLGQAVPPDLEAAFGQFGTELDALLPDRLRV